MLRLRPPLAPPDDAHLDRGPLLAETVLSALHASHDAFTLGIGSRDGKVFLFADGDEALLRGQVYAQYPEAEIDEVPAFDNMPSVSVCLALEQSEVLPLKSYHAFLDTASRRFVSPIAGILSALDGAEARVEIVLVPAHHARRLAVRVVGCLGQRLVSRYHAYGRFLTRLRLAPGWRGWAYWPLALVLCGRQKPNDHTTAAMDKLDRLLFHARVRLTVRGTDDQAERKLRALVASFRPFTLPHSNGFRAVKKCNPYLLSDQEIATLWHVPGPLTKAAGFEWLPSRKLEVPLELPPGEVTIGEAVFRAQRQRFGILQEDRRRHLYVVGKTGSGKSTLLLNLICADIRAGRGVAVIDPHGDLADAALRSLPRKRLNDLILFEPDDPDFAPSFNVLDCPPDQRQLAASGVVSVFKRMWPGLWSGRQEHITRNCLLALLEAGDETLLGVPRLFVDLPYRRKILSRVQDMSVRMFWTEYDGWTERYRAEAIAAVQNKVGQLLSVPVLRHILGQPKLKIDLRHAMDTSKVLVVNLSKGKLGEDVSAFLGSLMVTRIQIAGMGRANVREEDRVDFQVYVDEFQNYSTESFAVLMSEARKFRICLTVAHQFLSQLVMPDGSTGVRDAVFGNVGSMLCFQVGPDDAEAMSAQFEGAISPQDVIGLRRYQAFMRLLVCGSSTRPFSVETLPSPDLPQDGELVSVARRVSLARYAEKRALVEAGILRWSGDVPRGRGTQTTRSARHKA